MSESEIESTPEPIAQEIPKDLQDKKQAMRAIVTAHNLLNEGAFPRSAWGAIDQTVSFLKGLHAEVMESVLTHPDADKDSELKALKEQKNGQSQNSEAV